MKGMFQCYVGDVKVVDDVLVDIYLGEIYGFVGELGCGKSILLEIIIGFKLLIDGEVFFCGILLMELFQFEV